MVAEQASEELVEKGKSYSERGGKGMNMVVMGRTRVRYNDITLNSRRIEFAHRNH